MKKYFLLGVACFLMSLSSVAANLGSPITTIKWMSAYSQYGGGDVIFKIANPIPECSDGYWLPKSDAGFQASFSMLLSAYAGKFPVAIYAWSDQLWPGSGGKYCKIYTIDFN